MESTERIKGINFSFFSETEITRLAALEVKSQIAFDAFRNPWPEGLDDSRMGVSPYDRSGRCPTCGKDQHDCNGHLGFIRLVLPVYHLFLLKDLLRLLRAKCFFCDKFVAANGVNVLTAAPTGTFGTVPATITVPTTNVTAVGCVCELYTT